jgi:hypothetical protein
MSVPYLNLAIVYIVLLRILESANVPLQPDSADYYQQPSIPIAQHPQQKRSISWIPRL